LAEHSLKGIVEIEALKQTWKIFLGMEQWGELEALFKVQGHDAVGQALHSANALQFPKALRIALKANHPNDVAEEGKADVNGKVTVGQLVNDIGQTEWVWAMRTSWEFCTLGPGGRRFYELKINKLRTKMNTDVARMEQGLEPLEEKVEEPSPPPNAKSPEATT
jgi:hypothetical protein